MAQPLHIAEAQGARRLKLPGGQGLHGRAENLRLVGRAGQPQDEGARGQRRDIQVQSHKKSEVKKVEQHQYGQATEKPDIDSHQATRRPPAIDLGQSQRYAQTEAKPQGQRHHRQCDQGTKRYMRQFAGYNG